MVLGKESIEPMKGLNTLKGLSGLSEKERQDWIALQKQEGKLTNKSSFGYADRLYRNQMYISHFGLENFKSNPDYKLRDEEYKTDLISKEIDSKYANDDRYNDIKSLSLDSQLALLEGGYQGKDAIETNYSRRVKEATSVDMAGGNSGNYANQAKKAEERRDTKLFDKIQTAENKGLIKKADAYATEVANKTESDIASGILNIDEVKADVDSALSGGVKTINSPEGSFEVNMPKSSYWEIFKDRPELKNLTASDMARLKATYDYIVSSPEGNPSKAVSVIDTMLKDYIHNGETVWDWVGDTGRNIAAKAVASTMQGVATVSYLKNIGDAEKTAQFLSGKDENGNDLPLGQNLTYWNDVYQYNVFDVDRINKIKENDGVTPYKYMPKAGNEFKSFGAITQEAIGQGGNALAQVAMSYATGGIGKVLSVLPKVGKTLNGVARVGAIVGTALPESMMEAKIVYDETMRAIGTDHEDKVRNAAEQYAELGVTSGKYNSSIAEYVNNLKENQARLNAGKEKSLNLSDEYFEQQAIETLKAYLANQYYENNKDLSDEAKREAERSAVVGANTTFAIFAARNAAENLAFKDYLFDQGTRHLKWANKTNRSLDVVDDSVKQTNKTLNNVLAVANPVLGGGLSEYNDSLTEGFGEGIALNEFNTLTNHKYSDVDYLEGAVFTSNLLANLHAGTLKVQDAATSKEAFYEAAIGALGSVTSLVPGGLGETVRKDASTLERINRYIKNPLISAYYEEQARQRSVDEAITKANEIIAAHKDDIASIGRVIQSLNTRKSRVAYVDGKDDKEKQAYDIVTYLADLRSSKVGEKYTTGEEAFDTINTLAKGNKRNAVVQQAVNDYIADNDLEATEENKEDARLRIKKNAEQILKMYKSYSNISAKVGLDEAFMGTKEAKDQAIYSMVMNDTWKERLSSIEEDLSGSSKYSEVSSPKAIYPTLGTLDHELNQTKLAVANTEAKIKESEEQLETLKSLNKADRNAKDIERTKASIEQLKNDKQLLEDKITSLEKHGEVLSDGNVLTASEILHLNPEERAYMFEHKDLYSKEQRAEIDKLADQLLMTDKNTEYESQIKDAGTLYTRLKDNSIFFKAVRNNPKLFDANVAALTSSRNARVGKLKALRAYRTFERDIVDMTDEDLAKYAIEHNVGDALLEDYVKANPDKNEALQPIIKTRKLQADIFNSITNSTTIAPNAKNDWKRIISRAVKGAKTTGEVMSTLEDLLNMQVDEAARKDLESIISDIEDLGFSRDATKVQFRDKEKARKEAIAKEDNVDLSEVDKDGKNFGWEGYKVGDTIYNKNTGTSAIVSAFKVTDSGEKQMIVASRNADGTTKYSILLDKHKDSITKENPKPKEQPKVKESEETPLPQVPEDTSNILIQGEMEDVNIGSEGEVMSPTISQQAAEVGTTVTIVAPDNSDQGNNIDASNDNVLMGNKLVEYSLTELRDNHRIVKEIPRIPQSTFGAFTEWLHNNGIKLQEIIDEEFSRVYLDNPDVEIRFMMTKPKGDTSIDQLQTILFNVIEFTPEVQKYHKSERGGVITANGKQWLVVGTTGFARNSSRAQMDAYNITKGSISKRRIDYFGKNSEENYYVDPVAHTKVQNTTSGRVINQTEADEAPKLRRVSEVFKSVGVALKDIGFGIQMRESGTNVGTLSFATTSNVRDRSVVYPPINIAGNVGRVFVLLDTPNGNKIPGMIEPAMYNQLKEGSPLKDVIQKLLVQLTSKNPDERQLAIKELCKYLVLGKNKNILVAKNSNIITLRREGLADIVYNLDKDFDLNSFLKDVESTNFQVNIVLKTLENEVMLDIYDKSDALMTYVAYPRTVGMSYTIYSTDTKGQPVIGKPIGVSNPGERAATEFKTYRSVRVGNITYELKENGYVSRHDGSIVDYNSPLGISCLYNDDIQNNKRTIYYSKDGLEYYLYMDNNSNNFLVTRDGLGNVTVLSVEESSQVINQIEERRKASERLANAEDVIFEDTQFESQLDSAEDVIFSEEIEGLTEQQLQEQLALGVSTEPITKESTPEVTVADKNSTEPSKKDVRKLQNPESLAKFVGIINSREYGDTLYEVLEGKGWGITEDTSFDEIASVLEKHGISIMNIPEDIQQWIDMIKYCK